ncbi:phosphopantetheine-binding protein [Acerihabitans arboris]|uniref:Carrier domain-containing protein n=1 Tax=Acerihabitans arboris TaxID=2691583 RepID=A0A845S9U0_9GAMM|nr:phosphopantetheine-binding protein [Acerihabitans arboris]NDL61510.1 hypothetical protein [Acerihabitans arboris]
MENNMMPGSALSSDLQLIRGELYAMLAYRLGRKKADIAGRLNLAADLYVDSLDWVEIEIGVAETFGVELKENDVASMQTVDDLLRFLVEALDAQRFNGK